MRRKLVQQGKSTLMVSLPRKWTKKRNLQKGDEIDFIEENGQLCISAREAPIKKEASISLSGAAESYVRTRITNAYRAGYDKVHVTFKTTKQFTWLKQVVQTRLIGFEIITSDTSSCTIENVTEPSEELFETLLRKIFFNIKQQFELCTQENSATEQELNEIQERIQKYDNFCKRIICKGKTQNVQSEFLYAFLQSLVHAQREIYYGLKALPKNEISRNCFNLIKQSESLFALIAKAYREKDASLLSDVHQLEKDIVFDHSLQLIKEAKDEETLVLFRVLSAIRKFYLASSPLIGLLS